MTPKAIAGITLKNTEDLKKTYNRLNREQRQPDESNKLLERMLFISDHQSRKMDIFLRSFEKGDKGNIRELLEENNRYNRTISSGFTSLSTSIKSLVKRLEEIELNKKVLNSSEVQQEYKDSQRTLVKQNQAERDKAAPSMLLSGLLNSQHAPKWMQWLSNKAGLRTLDTKKENLREKESLNIDYAQTKIDLAKARKRRELSGVSGKGKNIKELSGMEDMSDEDMEARQLRVTGLAQKVKDRVDNRKDKVTEGIVNPFKISSAGPRINEGMKEAYSKKDDLSSIGETRLPLKKESGEETEKAREKYSKQLRGRSSTTREDGTVVIAFSKDTVTLLSKILTKTVREGTKLAILESLEVLFKTMGAGGEEDEEGVAGGKPVISSGPITGAATRIGKAGRQLANLAEGIPLVGGLFKGKKAHGGEISSMAGTGPGFMAVNPGEAISSNRMTDSYDTDLIQAPRGGGHVFTKKQTEALGKPGAENKKLEDLVAELIAITKKGNESLGKMAEQEIPEASPHAMSMPNAPKAPNRSTGRKFSDVRVL